MIFNAGDKVPSYLADGDAKFGCRCEVLEVAPGEFEIVGLGPGRAVMESDRVIALKPRVGIQGFGSVASKVTALATEIPMTDCNLTINCGSDGTWLHFTVARGRSASINVDLLSGGPFLGGALNDWCSDRQKQAEQIRRTGIVK